MKIQPIHTHQDYQAALSSVQKIMQGPEPEQGTPQANYLEVMACLIEDYERRYMRDYTTTAVEAIRFRMEQQGLAPQDIGAAIGAPDTVADILEGKQPLTLVMIRQLHEQFGIPAECLIRP